MSAPIPPFEDTFFRYVLDSAAIVARTDTAGTITYVNDKFCEISGYSETELIGANHRIMRSGMHDDTFFKNMYRDIASGRTWHGEICNRHKNGLLYWLDTTIVPHLSPHGKVDSYTAIRFDITERKRLEAALHASRTRLAQVAGFDALTGLPNRTRFQNQLEILTDEYRLTQRGFYLGMLDIDSFKEINETLGYAAGDVVLKTIASRIRPAGDERAFVARVGADEFALAMSGATPAQAEKYFQDILESVRKPIFIGTTIRHCSASLGIAICPEHADTADSLTSAAGLALTRAKCAGRDRIEYFAPELRESAERKAIVLGEIEKALAQGEFELHYQPIVSLRHPGRFSLEGLLRWRHPELGLLTPNFFSEALEDQGLRAEIGMYVLERLFRDTAQFYEQGIHAWRIAINLTNSEFRSDAFIDRFFDLCADTGIAPSHFCMEVTEGMFLGYDQHHVENGLRRLHQGGVEVALDDFGTGYASLTHLRRLPTDRLKIDMSFVANMTTSAQDRAIVKGIIDIAHSLGKTVAAEGVETIEQVQLLREMGCDLLQGWYFGKACPTDELRNLLESMPQV